MSALVPGLRRRLQRLPGLNVVQKVLEQYPRGHFYSPLPDLEEVSSAGDELYASDCSRDGEIDLRVESQLALLHELGAFHADFDWPLNASPGRRYYLGQEQFVLDDALMLFGVLRWLRPARVIEVGSGHSSALMLDTNDRFLDGATQFTFVEPYPDRLLSVLHQQDLERQTLLRRPVQAVDLRVFEELREGDVLFIDSSHVARIGSDVNFLFFRVLPALRSGVVVHFHDIFWPFDYPTEWVLRGRAWNESYLLRAFLMHNDRYEILLFNHFLATLHADALARAMPRLKGAGGGGSIWLRKR